MKDLDRGCAVEEGLARPNGSYTCCTDCHVDVTVLMTPTATVVEQRQERKGVEDKDVLSFMLCLFPP